MNRILTTITLCLMAAAAMAQQKADIIVSYKYVNPTKYGKSDTTKMSLLANQTEAKYFNDLSLWVDSLRSTPEGNDKYIKILEKTCIIFGPDGSITVDTTKGPAKKIYDYVFTNLNDGFLTQYNKYGEDLGYYTEPIDEIQWAIIEDSTSTVLGYECVMATAEYHGRHWKAWFSPEIPMSFGPWKLRGLPGLVFKAEANGDFSFEATGIEQTDRMITPMYLKENYTKTDRKKALEDAEYYANNVESILNARGMNVRISSNSIEPEYDGLKHSIEPDYKIK